MINSYFEAVTEPLPRALHCSARVGTQYTRRLDTHSTSSTQPASWRDLRHSI